MKSLLARFFAPCVTHDAAGEACLLQGQPQRSAQEAQADNRHAPKMNFCSGSFQGLDSREFSIWQTAPSNLPELHLKAGG
jgi:hypothetical protein